jgi:hypothetical protein
VKPLNAVIIPEHLEADGVLSADEFLLWIDANIEVVIEQIIVRTIASVFSSQNVRAWFPVESG